MNPLVACVANFSEGRHSDVVDEIVGSIASVNGVAVLGHEHDEDHNRAVVTFAGAPVAVSAAAYVGIECAARLIDMDKHSGQHPRIGAADVVPFVPLRHVGMPEGVRMARSLGERVGRELRLPVFLYQEAALCEANRELADIRRGGFERLRRVIGTDKGPKNDLGPSALGKAGACVIGARHILIAFNVYLTTDDPRVARLIARRIRQSSGGLPCVKALGLLIKGQAQVSMNLTDYRVTPIYRAVEAVRREAQSLGYGIARTELIGLLPRAALEATEGSYVQIDNFSPDRVLENRLAACFGEEYV